MESYSNISNTNSDCESCDPCLDNAPFVSSCQSSCNFQSDISTHFMDDNKNVKLEGETKDPGLSNVFIKNTNTGIILLGRGNSFTMGRSEAIFLKTERRKLTKNPQTESKINEDYIGQEHLCTSHSFTPPPISNGVESGKSTIDMCHTQGGNFDAIENLWRGVESIMLAKQGVVEQVLEEYGIGEAENGEEESVWQVVQENFKV